MALSIACAIYRLASSSVERDGLKLFAKTLNPAFKVPCSKTIRARLRMIAETGRDRLAMMLAGRGETLAMTTDTWTGVNGKSYQGETAHWITRQPGEWKRLHAMLCIARLSGGKTTKIIVKALDEQNKRVGIDWRSEKKASSLASPMRVGLTIAWRPVCAASTMFVWVTPATTP